MRVGIDARLVPRGLGIATFVKRLTEEFRDQPGHDVQPVWLGASPPEGVEHAPVRGPYPRLELLATPRLARTHRLSVVHFTANSGPPRALSVPTVLTLHDLIFLTSHPARRSLRQNVGHTYERLVVPRALRSAGALATVSEHVRGLLQDRFDLSAEVIGHGGPPVRERATPTVPPRLAAFAGRDPRKNTATILEAFQQLRATHPAVGLDLFARAGLPADLDGRLLEAVDLHEDLARSEVDRRLASAVALLFLSEDEGFGLPLLEAFAVGTPVIAGPAPASLEVGGNAALRVLPGDLVGQTVAHARRLLDTPSDRDVLAAAGHAVLRQRSWNQAATAYAALYAQVARA